ncbi:site-specific DNA-methyltransferase [Flavobacterium sp. ABG]|uniref:site-specific DNA-methyltransferase n=1 Tax=Flavobacterium sp. ABG TaxID=1423322 RepID=UPI0013F3CD94|nr:site-specific DNA-methyltransferase [Flavobacterium sp. ABG]
MNLVDYKIIQLKNIFPEIFSEDKIDLQRLKQILDDDAFSEGEHYELSWAGKIQARKEIQRQTTSTLKPVKDESIDFDSHQNILIEGENLDVLRLLQKSYFGKVKMIYIDPPYNTGSDSFVYPDDYTETREEYQKRTGAKDLEGFLNKQNSWNKNIKENGQFHSVWLSMMYPRLYLSRNLLREDGVIFISIDENEAANLKLLCDEVFGSENFRNTLAIRRYDKNLNTQFIENGLKTFNVGYEYIFCYAKSDEFSFNPILKEGNEDRMNFGYWKGFWNDADRPTMRFDILGFTPEGGQWKWSKEKANEAVDNYSEYQNKYSSEMSLEDYWIKTDKKKSFIRRNLNGQGRNKGVEHWIAPSNGALRNTNWTDLFASKSEKLIEGFFDFPKNVDVIKNLIVGSCDDDDLILDFFSGSGTTAQAVLELNETFGGERRFICVQMPELLDEKSNAYKAGHKTIADITKLRISKVIKKLKKVRQEKLSFEANQKLSFSFYKLSDSNFKIWQSDLEGKNAILEQLTVFQQSEKGESEHENMLTELLLKTGLGLNAKYSKEGHFFKTENIWICFEPFEKGMKEEIISANIQKAIFLNSCFTEDKQLSNFQLQLKEHKIKLILI